MSRVVWRGIVVTALVGCLSGQAWAQLSTGAIAGTVTDNTGAVLPGATVTVSGARLIGGTQTVVTDQAGTYRFDRLPPGSYDVKFEIAGFRTVDRREIAIDAAFTATVNADMRVGALEETITVTGDAPTVDVQNITQQRVMTRDVIDNIPVGTKSVTALGVLLPGVTTISQDVGGTQYGSAAIAVHGSRVQEQQLVYDGMYYNHGGGRGDNGGGRGDHGGARVRIADALATGSGRI